jgi:hypothetical protein
VSFVLNRHDFEGALTLYDWPSNSESIPRACYKSARYKYMIYSHLNDETVVGGDVITGISVALLWSFREGIDGAVLLS